MPNASHGVRRATGALRSAASRGRRTRQVLLASTVIGVLAAPLAFAAVDGGERNPSRDTSSGYQRETEIIGNIAQNQGGLARNTGGYTTRQSNKSDTGGGAIYGCRARAGTESCVAANNLNNGDAFRFQASPTAGTIGQLRFGVDIARLVDKPPFATNGTGMVKNLNADRVDGHSAEDFVGKGSLLFAVVGKDGAIGGNRGLPPNAKAKVSSSGGNQVFTVPFASDVSNCSMTANATDVEAPTLAVSPGSDKSHVVVRQKGTTPYGFHLQVVC